MSGGGGVKVDTIKDSLVKQHYDNRTYNNGAGGARELVIEQDFPSYPDPQLERLLQETICDEEEVSRVEAILSQHRLAVITGDPEVGKGTLARLVAARLHDRGRSLRVGESPPLHKEIRVPLDRLCEQGKFGPGVFLFCDFLAKGNSDLAQLAESLIELRLGTLGLHLRRQDSFLLLTSDRANLDKVWHRLHELQILHHTAGPPLDKIRVLLARKADDLAIARRVDDSVRSSIQALVAASDNQIAQRLRTPRRVREFLDRYLIAVADGSLSLEQALERFHHLADWLLQDLAHDRDTQSFALALVLAQPHPQLVGAHWLLVHDLAREISRHLRRVLREPPGERTPVASESRLDRLNAEVRRSPARGDLVRFKDFSYSEQLWKVLLGPGRELLSLLVPLLRRLAEQPLDSAGLQYAAACALGRCGEMDPHALVIPTIREWLQSEQPAHYLALGALVKGALGSSDPAFRDSCLGVMRHEIEVADTEKAWPLAIALREIGWDDLTNAVDGLILLVAGTFGRNDFRFEAEGLRLALAESAGAVLDDPRDALAPSLRKGEGGLETTLTAVQYALVGLCYLYGPLAVMRELAGRLAEHERGRLKVLLPLLTLRWGGIVDELEGDPLLVAAPAAFRAAGRIVMSRFLAAAKADSQGPRDLADLLSTCHLWCAPLPPTFAADLRQRLLDLLRVWGHQVVKLSGRQPEVWDTGRALFARLRRSPSLGEEVFLLLRTDADFSLPSSELARLVREALEVPGEPG